LIWCTSKRYLRDFKVRRIDGLFWLFSFVELLKRGCEKIWSGLKRTFVELRKHVWEHVGPLGLLMLFSGVSVRFFYKLICFTDWFNVSLIKTAEKPDPQVLFVFLAIFLTGMPLFTYLSLSLKHDPSRSFEGMCDTVKKIVHVKRAMASTVVGIVPACVLYILGYIFFKKDFFGYGALGVIGVSALVFVNTGFASAQENQHRARNFFLLTVGDVLLTLYGMWAWEESQKDYAFHTFPSALIASACFCIIYDHVTHSLEILPGIPDNSKVSNVLFKNNFIEYIVLLIFPFLAFISYAQSDLIQFIKRMPIWERQDYTGTLILLAFQVLVIVIHGGVLLITKRLALGLSQAELLGKGLESQASQGRALFLKNAKARVYAVMLGSKIRWKKSVKKVQMYRKFADSPHVD
jgi:hypothetical protein